MAAALLSRSLRLSTMAAALLSRSLRLSTRHVARPIFPLRRQFQLSAPRLTKYTQDHEWIDLHSDSDVATVGITSYASTQLGDVVFVELPELDLEVAAGDTMGAVESVKSASDILSPVSGTVVEANKELGERPGTINKDPEGQGWIAKIRVTEEAKGEFEELLSDMDYKKLVEGAE